MKVSKFRDMTNTELDQELVNLKQENLLEETVQ